MLGDKIKELRKVNRVTQQQLADAIGFSRSAIGMLESNKNGASPDKLKELADFFGVTVDYLLTDEETGLNEKDRKLINKDLKMVMDEFRDGTNGTAFYNGQEINEDDLDLIESAMKIALEQIKIRNKEKYTPNKYKK